VIGRKCWVAWLSLLHCNSNLYCFIAWHWWIDYSAIGPQITASFCSQTSHSVFICEIRANDLSSQSPYVAMRELLDLVYFLQSVDFSNTVSVSKVLLRQHHGTGLPWEDINRVTAFNKMLEVLFDDRQCSPFLIVLLPDDIYLNCSGQYCPYWSYRFLY